MSTNANKYRLSKALQTSTSHPFGKGAFESELSAEKLVKKAEEKGYSDKNIASKAQAVANISHSEKAEETARLARKKAHSKREFKEDRSLAIA